MASQFFMFAYLLATCTFLTLVAVSGRERSKPDPDSIYVHKGVICFKCPAGNFVYRHCTSKFTHSDCDACPKGTFQRHRTRAESCGKCKKYCHIRNMVIVKNCTSTSDIICQCKPGYFLKIFNKHLNIRGCKAFTPCGEGEVVTRNGMPFQDQQCSSCPNGTYASNGICLDCTSCMEKNVAEIMPCNSTADAVCGDGELLVVNRVTSLIVYILPGVAVPVLLVIVILCTWLRVKRMSKDKETIEMESMYQPEQVVSLKFNSRTDGNSSSSSALRSRRPSLQDSLSLGSNKIYKPGLQRASLFTDHSEHLDPLLDPAISRPGLRRVSTLPDHSESVDPLLDPAICRPGLRRVSTLPDHSESVEPLLGPIFHADDYAYSEAETDHWVDEIFREISKRLGHDWEEFIRSLPGDREWISVSNSICCQTKENHPHNVQESIYQSLLKWKEHCPLHITMRNIVRALSQLQSPKEKKQMAEYLVEKYNKIVLCR